MSKFKNISLDKIEAAAQVRQSFDDKLIAELAESIKQQGVLQPILVRPIGKTFQIVAGERRWRAAKLAGLKDIPSHVKEMDDTQALEAQISENLQRKDVHPMDEAHAFNRLIEEAKLSMEDIAAKVAKTTKFVAQRLKLLALIPEVQEVFHADKIPAAGAMRIAILSPEKQKEFFDDELSNWEEDDFYMSTGDIKRELEYQGEELSRAKFPLEDTALLSSAGACTDCQKNTACFKLLFQEEGVGRCMDSDCFERKQELFFQNSLQKVVDENPEYLLLPNRWSGETSEVKAAKSMGLNVEDPHKWKVISEPKAPNESDFDMSDEDDKETYESELRDYNDDFKEWSEAIKQGAKKAFLISGHEKGQVVLVVPSDDSKSINDPKEEIEEVKMSNQIFDLVEKRKRNDQLLKESLFAWSSKRFIEEANGENNYYNKATGLSHLEETALYLILFGQMSYTQQRKLANDFNFDQYQKVAIYNFLESADTDVKTYIMRAAIVEKIAGGEGKNQPGEVKALLPIAEDFFNEEFTQEKESLIAKYEKRNNSLEKQIAELKSKANK